MQNKVYTKDLSLDEIFEKLKKGQGVHSSGIVYLYNDGVINCYDKKGNLLCLNSGVSIDVTTYFLDEVEEPKPEVDESCIGKLCEFWDGDKNDDYIITVLLSINPKQDCPYEDDTQISWEHCRPLTKEEALALVKE